jgi:hypothetical protein
MLAAIALAGCSSPQDEAAQKAQDAEDLWLAMGGEGEMPPSDAASIRTVIEDVTDRANDVLMNGSDHNISCPMRYAALGKRYALCCWGHGMLARVSRVLSR